MRRIQCIDNNAKTIMNIIHRMKYNTENTLVECFAKHTIYTIQSIKYMAYNAMYWLFQIEIAICALILL